MPDSELSQVSVLTFNILYGGTYLGLPLEQTAAAICSAQVDIVVICEQCGNAQGLADVLGLTCHVVAAPPYWQSVALLSRYPVVESFANGARLNLGGGQSLCVFGVHLTSSPYQPYRVRDGCYERKEELLIEARQTRERELLGVLAEIHPLIKGGEKVILCGDFNEPSHLDWTRACADLHFGLEMAWPCSCEVASIGMQDAYRKLFPDPHSHPGHTWTPVPGKGAGGGDTAEHEVHDRIDFVYGSGAGLVPIETVVIGEHHDHADIVVSPFPSDHRGVKVIYEIGQTED